MTDYTLNPIGFIRSELRNVDEAPLFYTEGAPNARLELLPAFGDGLASNRMKRQTPGWPGRLHRVVRQPLAKH
jgi:hypothetical protein